MDETSPAWSPGGISDVIREHPIPFVMFAASAGILLAAWMGYRRYGMPSVSDRSRHGSIPFRPDDGRLGHAGRLGFPLRHHHRRGRRHSGSDPPRELSSRRTARTLRTDANPPIFDRP